MTYLLTDLRTYIRTYWLTDRLTNLITYLLTYLLTDWLTDWLIYLLTYLLTDWLTDLLTDWQTELLTGVFWGTPLVLKPHLSFCPSPHSVDLKWSLCVITSNERKNCTAFRGTHLSNVSQKKPPKKPRSGNTVFHTQGRRTTSFPAWDRSSFVQGTDRLETLGADLKATGCFLTDSPLYFQL